MAGHRARPPALAAAGAEAAWKRSVLVVLGAILLASPPFLSAYWVGLLTQMVILAILAMSLDVLLGYTGLASLGHAGFFGVAAYGVGVLSTVPGGGYGYKQGTSMAAPHVAGVAALLKSAHPKATPAQLQRMLKAQADKLACPDKVYDGTGNLVDATTCQSKWGQTGYYGHGLVNALNAVR